MIDLNKKTVISECKNCNVHIILYIENNCLKLDSFVFGNDFDSEAHYIVDQENTNKLLKQVNCNGDLIKSIKNLYDNKIISSFRFEEVCKEYGIRYELTVI